MTPRVLVADDQIDVLEALRILLKGAGYDVETVASPAEVLAALETRDFDVLLLDMNYTRDTTGGQEGLDLIARIRATDAMVPIVVMTAWGSVGGAVEAIRRGARDYIEKPWENARLLATVATHVALARALRQTERLEGERHTHQREGLPLLIAESAVMRPVLRLMERVAPSDANALILGEHGTGKELVAQWIHAASQRSACSLIAVNVGGLPDGVFEAELFGHVKGAFTDAKSDRVGRFELADGGTILLDEIANTTPQQQAKLLRVLETHSFERIGSSKTRQLDVRVLAATNADPTQEVAAGRFREDLLFRLNTIEIRLPPLRQRTEDIPLLAAHFLARHAQRYGAATRSFDDGAMEALLAHQWPGNVRELDHAVERAVLLSDGSAIRAADLGLRSTATDGGTRLEDLPLQDVERVLIRKALARQDGNVAAAARLLGLSRSAMYRRMERYGL
jgi:DNA-binding NtrC family response regulator